MKKLVFAILVCSILVYLMGATPLATRTSSYSILHTDVGCDETDPDADVTTGYYIITSKPTNAVDLQMDGRDTYANGVQIILYVAGGADDDTVTQNIYGISLNGPRQLIAVVVWKIGTAQVDATATNLWAHDAAITSTHKTTITEADGDEGDGVCSISFDVTGFRYLESYFSAQTGSPTSATALYRYW